MKKLTSREQAFADAYASEAAGNGQKAAELAGYAKGSARVTACRLLKKANITAAIANRQDEVAKRAAEADAVAKAAEQEAHESKIADAVERREILTRIARAGRNKKFAVPAIKAMDVLNKMDGLYVTRLSAPGPDGQPLGMRRVIIELDDAQPAMKPQVGAHA